tara:strand:- start:226 stop:639 length:414 start_codon:yes stop_codon:yes gene_type:complete
MALATVQNTLLDRFKAQYDASAYSSLTIAWSNQQFTPPDNAGWFRVNVLPGGAFRASLGGSVQRFRNTGLLVVDCFQPKSDTDAAAIAMADAVAGWFRGVSLTAVSLIEAPSITRLGDEDNFYGFSVVVPYRYDDTV